MGYIENLATAKGGRAETEAAVREILSAPPDPGMQTQFLHLSITGRPGQVEEASTDD